MRVEVPAGRGGGRRTLSSMMVIMAIVYPWWMADVVSPGMGWPVGLAAGCLVAACLAVMRRRVRAHPPSVEVDDEGIRGIAGQGRVWWSVTWATLWRVELGEGSQGPQFRVAGRGERPTPRPSTPELNEAIAEQARLHGVRVVAVDSFDDGSLVSRISRHDRQFRLFVGLWIVMVLAQVPSLLSTLGMGRPAPSLPGQIGQVVVVGALAFLPRPYTTEVAIDDEGVVVTDWTRRGTLRSRWRYAWRDVSWLTARRSVGDVIAEVQVKGASNTSRWRLDPNSAQALVDAAANHGVRASSRL